MRHLWLGILACAAMLVACGDDGSDSATRPSEGSSSGAISSSRHPGLDPESSNKGDGGSHSSSSRQALSAMTSSSSAIWKTAWNYLNPNIDYQEFVDDRDGQTYKFVKIGDHWWMAENLNFEVDSSFCYKDSAEYCEKYGRLYKWEVADHVCPNGWYLPGNGDFETFTSMLAAHTSLLIPLCNGCNKNVIPFL